VVFVTHNIAEAMFLSHRIVILAQGTVAEIIENPLPIPRQRNIRSTPEFAKLYGRVSLAMERAAS
jgi:NitT/TauT family transport system ATP-binding protein